MLQRIRDEAHRFAITFQRAKRKNDIGSVLAEVPGLGPARVKVLLKHFGSVKRLKEATPAQIGEVRGIGPALAEAIVARLGHDSDHPTEPGEATASDG
jgi:excinuclease ABC subunit C